MHGPPPFPPGAIRFTFVSSPDYHVVVVVPGLAERLAISGRKTVSVQFEIHCTVFGRLVGWSSIRALDGEQVAPPVEGWNERASSRLGLEPLSCR
jgi:hypothetical protein